MNTIAFAIEGVLAKDPPFGGYFSAATPIQEGIDLYLEFRRPNTVLVTGVNEHEQVEHWLGVQHIRNAAVQYCDHSALPETWQRRLMAFEKLGRTLRSNLTVIEGSRVIRDALIGQGVTVLQPWFGHRHEPLGDDDVMPLRSQWASWDS